MARFLRDYSLLKRALYGTEVRSKITSFGGYGEPSEVTCGGHALKFYASIRLNIRRMGFAKKGEEAKSGFQSETLMTSNGSSSVSAELKCPLPHLFHSARMLHPLCSRAFSTTEKSPESTSLNSSSSISDFGPQIKFKRLDKTSRHIMQILDKEAVEEVKSRREIPDIRPGYIVQLKVEVPENKRRVSTLKGIVIARRNAGLNTTFRLRRLVAGVGVESLFPLYSPNIKEIKVLDKKKVRRAKLYYLRDKMNALKKH